MAHINNMILCMQLPKAISYNLYHIGYVTYFATKLDFNENLKHRMCKMKPKRAHRVTQTIQHIFSIIL